MDKVFSTRLDESVIDELTRLSRKLGIPKKRLLEEAIRDRVAKERESSDQYVWAETCGAWQRGETPATTVRKVRQSSKSSLRRHHEG